MRELKFSGLTGACRILIGGSLKDLGALADPDKTVLVVDPNVARLYPRLVSGYRWIDSGCGEAAKNLRNIEKICRRLLELGADRSTLVVGIGGGVACDITGFAASIFMRGLAFGLAPTTLLAQADAGVGGKNGVNLGGHKNIVGLFSQPAFVLMDFAVLRTLPGKERIGGAAEIVKHALIGDSRMFADLEKNRRQLVALDRNALAKAVGRSVEMKIGIVNADEREAGERRKLNFGHTLGHALEKEAAVSHGEAVAMGMSFAARVSARRGLLSGTDADRVESLLRGLGLPVKIPVAAGRLVEAVRKDKKREGESIHFVALRGIGNAVVMRLTLDELEELIHDLC